MTMITVSELKKELNKLGIKTYKSTKTQASFVKRSEVKKVLAHLVKAACEMAWEDLEEGGEFYQAAKELKDTAKRTGLFDKVEPFDVYQGPYALLKNGDKIWLSEEEEMYWVEKKHGESFLGDSDFIADYYKRLAPKKPQLKLVK